MGAVIIIIIIIIIIITFHYNYNPAFVSVMCLLKCRTAKRTPILRMMESTDLVNVCSQLRRCSSLVCKAEGSGPGQLSY
jgi:hypothetical protein